MPECPYCREPLGDAHEGMCSRCGSYIVVDEQTGSPRIVRTGPTPFWYEALADLIVRLWARIRRRSR
jgi:hypothetical protein